LADIGPITGKIQGELKQTDDPSQGITTEESGRQQKVLTELKK
jgi:hypothetical protein